MQWNNNAAGSMTHPAKKNTSDANQNSNIPLWRDQRRYRRIHLSVTARFLLPDQAENSGIVEDISAGGLSIKSDIKPKLDDDIIVYLDQLGGYEGKVVRLTDTGFSVEFKSSPAKRERTVNHLTWIANNPVETSVDNRQFSRDRVSKTSHLQRTDGTEMKCTIMDMSVGGMAINVADKLPIGEIIMIGRMEGRVVRHFSGGVGIEFLNIPQSKRHLTKSLF